MRQVPASWWSSPPRPHRCFSSGFFLSLLDGSSESGMKFPIQDGEVLLLDTLSVRVKSGIDVGNVLALAVNIYFKGSQVWYNGWTSLFFQTSQSLPYKWKIRGTYEGPGEFYIRAKNNSDSATFAFNVIWDAWILSHPWRADDGAHQ